MQTERIESARLVDASRRRQTYTYTHTNTHARTRTHTHIHIDTHTQTHTHTYPHTRTHKHIKWAHVRSEIKCHRQPNVVCHDAKVYFSIVHMHYCVNPLTMTVPIPSSSDKYIHQNVEELWMKNYDYNQNTLELRVCVSPSKTPNKGDQWLGPKHFGSCNYTIPDLLLPWTHQKTACAVTYLSRYVSIWFFTVT